MTASDIVAIIAGAGTPLTIIGGGVAWIMKRVDRLDQRLKISERRGALLEREHGRVLVLVQRWRTAFQLVAGELQKLDPDNRTLTVAQSMLKEKVPDFNGGPTEDDPDDEDLKLLHKLTQGLEDDPS